MRFTVLSMLFVLPATAADPRPGPIPDDLRAKLKLDKFYERHADAGGLPVVGSAKVTDNALAEAAWIVGKMLDGRQDVLKAMAAGNVRVAVMAASEYTTDLPEHSRMAPKQFWDRRARGLGATPRNPVVSCAEENLLTYLRDPYPNENIFVHEFAHAIHGTGLNKTDPTFDRRLRDAYSAARERGLWKNTYAGTNVAEYWAEGVQCWFDDNAPADALHNEVRTRKQLREYDAGLAKLCEEVFGDKPWRYVKPGMRKPEDRAHLVGYDAAKLPRFRWREVPVGDTAKVTIQTAVGDFDVELDAKGAPEATKNFLAVALDGGYHSGAFERAGDGLVVASPSAAWREKWMKDLKLADVPAKPGEGMLALVRNPTGPPVSFAVVVGSVVPDPLLPFGKVTKGMDVVKKIAAAPAEGGRLKPAIDIRRVIRSE